MSDPGASAKTSWCRSAAISLPGRLPATVRVVRVPGQTRKSSALTLPNGSSPKRLYGGRRILMWISVAVTGMHLPARMMIGTSAQRQESMNRRVAKNVSVDEPAATPSTSR
jgi:hypothetical protein